MTNEASLTSFERSTSAPGEKPSRKRTPGQNELARRIGRIWARHQQWPLGSWPSNRRHDAVLIGQWSVKLALSDVFWRQAIGRVPVGARFVWLTTPPEPTKICRLQEWAIDHIRERETSRQRFVGGPANATAIAKVETMIGDLAKKFRLDSDWRTTAQEEAAREIRRQGSRRWAT